jgi:UDP-N-acetylmuramate--alanine ligase
MNLAQINSVYFVGVGGIGMSALARYFHAKGAWVYGYDRVQTDLTRALESLGVKVSYVDEIGTIPEDFLNADPQRSLVIYTPAIPQSNSIKGYLTSKGFTVIKRSEALEIITRGSRTIAVAGTHGKTTTSALVAHVLKTAGVPVNAFLGGITTNYNTNCLLDEDAEYTVVEADEYDRSFLRLNPDISIITSVDPDHLDIYNSSESVASAFEEFAGKLKQEGVLITANDIAFKSVASKMSYGIHSENVQLKASNIRVEDGKFKYDVFLKDMELGGVESSYPGLHNIENALAAVAVGLVLSIDWKMIKNALESFKGVKRRFEYHINKENRVYIDDYAHHPSEINACVGSVKQLYPNSRITGVFQPHLYSRTRDFADDFARSLESLNELLLMEIYPAREEPIEGVSSSMLLDKIQMVNKKLCQSEDVIDEVLRLDPEVLLTLGAGDIDKLVAPIKDALNKKDE